MSHLLPALLVPTGVLVILGLVILVDRLRAPHRDPRKPIAVVDRRTFRDATQRVDKLIAIEDFPRAWAVTVAICTWLKSERLYGSDRRRAWFAKQLETWTARRAEFTPFAAASVE